MATPGFSLHTIYGLRHSSRGLALDLPCQHSVPSLFSSSHVLSAWPRASLLKRRDPKTPHLRNGVCHRPFPWLLPPHFPLLTLASSAPVLPVLEVFPRHSPSFFVDSANWTTLRECTIWLLVIMVWFPLYLLPSVKHYISRPLAQH